MAGGSNFNDDYGTLASDSTGIAPSANSETQAFRSPQTQTVESAGASTAVKSDSSTQSPFCNRTPVLDAMTEMRLYVFGMILLPVRVILFFVALAVAAAASWLALVGLSPEARRKALPYWRRVIRAPLFPMVRMLLLSLGFWPGCIHVEGELDPRARVVVYNHVTFVDPTILEWLVRGVPVSAAENSAYPLIGSMIAAVQSVLIRRSDGSGDEAAHAARVAAAADMDVLAHDAAMPPLLVAPEGMCTNGTIVASFKPGAFAPMSTVQPVVIRYSFKHFDPTWLAGGPTNLVLLLRHFASPMSGAEVAFLPMMAPTAAEATTRTAAMMAPHDATARHAHHEAAAAYACRVQSAVAAKLRVPATQYAQADQSLVRAALRHGVVPPTAVVPEGGLTTLGHRATLPFALAALADYVSSGRSDGDSFQRYLSERVAAADAAQSPDASSGTPTTATP